MVFRAATTRTLLLIYLYTKLLIAPLVLFYWLWDVLHEKRKTLTRTRRLNQTIALNNEQTRPFREFYQAIKEIKKAEYGNAFFSSRSNDFLHEIEETIETIKLCYPLIPARIERAIEREAN